MICIDKSVPVVGRYDVVVCGGGPSGFVSAVAAARMGVSVAIIERYGFFGGMATAGLVCSCISLGLYFILFAIGFAGAAALM